MEIYLPRVGNSRTQVRETAAAIRIAIKGQRLPVRLTFGRLGFRATIAPHLMSACLNVAAEKIAAEVGHPVRVEGEKGRRVVVVG